MPLRLFLHRTVLLIPFLLFQTVSASDKAIDSGDTAVMEFCHRALFRGKFFIEHYREQIRAAAPAERKALWESVLTVIADSHDGNHPEAAAAADALLAAYPLSSVGETNRVFLLRLRGWTLGKAQDFAAAAEAYEKTLREFGSSPNPAVIRETAFAMNHLAVTLAEMGRHDDAVRAYDALLTRFASETDTILKELTDASGLMKGMLLTTEGFRDEGRLALLEATNRRPLWRDDEDFVGMMVDLQMVTQNLSAPAEPASARRQPAPSLPQPTDEEKAAESMGLQAQMLAGRGDAGAAEAFDAVIEQYRDRSEPRLRLAAAFAMTGKAEFQMRQGDTAAAVRTYDAFADHFREVHDPEVQSVIAMGMAFRGTAYSRAGNPDGAVRACDETIDRFQDHPDDSAQEMAALAMLLKARLLEETGRLDSAAEAADFLIGKYGDHPSRSVRDMAEKAVPLKKYLDRTLDRSR